MSSRIFLQALLNKLKGGNLKSIHLNALPGRLVARLDLKQFDIIKEGLAQEFLDDLLSKPSFEFPITFNHIDLNEVSQDEQKKLSVISKRLNAIIADNDDYHKEHGTKTLAFGYPILIKRSKKDPTKVIKAPLFIWPLEALRSKTKINEWTFLRNKSVQENGKIIDTDIHPVQINEVLVSFIKGEDDIVLPSLSAEILEDSVLDSNELLQSCADILHALNSGPKSDHLLNLVKNFGEPVKPLPEANQVESIANNNAYIYFGGTFGLFRAQKESIISDLTKLLERFDDFEFDNLVVDNPSTTPFSAVDTDPSQQAIIGALGKEANQVIQGPPGTGKSQSLTALITNALANNLKCLVVCEKKTALDVLKRNLERKNDALGSLVAVIDDVNDDREAIVDSVRERQDKSYNVMGLRLAQMQYETATNSIETSVQSVNQQHKALAKNLYRGKTWGDLVGRYLQLRKIFGEVPLRNALRREEFQFKEDERELYDTTGYLQRAEALHHQSKHLHPALDKIHSSIFLGPTVGEAREKVGDFVGLVLNELPAMEEYARTALDSAIHWLSEEFSQLPDVIQREISPYKAFLEGALSTQDPLPESLALERFITETVTKLKALQVRAAEFVYDYQERLKINYSTYGRSIEIIVSDYLTFAEENVSQYGAFFLRNDATARFKTLVLGLIIEKFRQIKVNRLEIRGKIVDIRKTHIAKPYIDHLFNDDEDVGHLSKYIDNIVDLKKKADTFHQSYHAIIGDYLIRISETDLHPDFGELKPQLRYLLNEFNDIRSLVAKRCNIHVDSIPVNLYSIQDQMAQLLDHLGDYGSAMQAVRRQFKNQLDRNKRTTEIIDQLMVTKDGNHIFPNLFGPYHHLSEVISGCKAVREYLTLVNTLMPEFRVFHDWRCFLLAKSGSDQKIISIIGKHLAANWADGFECWYHFTLLTYNEPPNLPKDDYELVQFRQKKEHFNTAQVNKILSNWANRQRGSVARLREKGQAVNSLFNKKGSKGMRRNSLRTIIIREFELFTDFFPVLLVNPSVCSSILPLEEGLFDTVIFDEASQLRLEETYAALLRGKAKIISGDKHQMPPSNYFQTGGAVLDPDDEETGEEDDVEFEERQALHASHRDLAESESLLAFAEDKGYKQQYLDIHYRSKHPFLIDFSNHAFYGMRLIPVPPLEDYIPISYLQVDGLYENQTNKAEVVRVIDLIENQIDVLPDGTFPTVGVATLNLYQRNLILDEISKKRQESTSFDAKISRLGDSFFVKNLENIQGDERDIIILSTTFGKKENGKFSQNFGPIIQSKGHRMLNVIITRARHKLYICNSFPLESVGQYSELLSKLRNRGRAVFYAYLMYAKAVSEGNDGLRQSILAELSRHCSEKHYQFTDPGEGSESPFEEEVYSVLIQHINPSRIIQQHKVGGFRIDMVVLSKDTGKPMIAVECDGANYHSSEEAYAWDLFRQDQLEQYGFKFHRIWSTKWWDAPERETDLLLDFIYKIDGTEVSSGEL